MDASLIVTEPETTKLDELDDANWTSKTKDGIEIKDKRRSNDVSALNASSNRPEKIEVDFKWDGPKSLDE